MTAGGMRRFLPGALVAVLVTFSTFSVAQQNYGTILGTVVDQSGAVVPGATVRVTNVGTQVTRETTSDKLGFYQVLSLPIGDYAVSVSKAGFRTLEFQKTKLEINQNLRVDAQLQVGTTGETVTVEAQASGVETVSSTLAQSVTSRPIVNLPLNGRNVLDLAFLQPGVSPADNNGNGGTASATTAFSISGGRNDSNTFILDGGNNNNLLSNGVVFNPNPDAIAEYKILTSNFAAEYGRNAGGIVTVVTKSGTSSYHGSAFEFNRNDAYNANRYFNNLQGLPRDVLKRNQFGGTFGGPLLPISSLKDKMFFFFSYQGTRQVQTTTSSIISTFTPAEVKGDFSGSSKQASIAKFLTAHPFFQPNAALAAQGIMDPTKIDPIAQAYLKANLIPIAAQAQAYGGSATNNADQLESKFDFNVTNNDRVMVTLGKNDNPILNPFTSTTSAPGFASTTTAKQYFANIGYTRIFSPTVLNEFRFTAQRNNQLQAVPAAKLPKPADLGITGITSDNPTGPTRLSFSGLIVGFSTQGPTALIDNTFSYSDTLSWTKGKHSMKLGGYFSPYQNNTLYDFYINGSYGFSSSNGAGDQHANFLLGLPRSYTQFPQAPSNIRSKASYFFGQDDWHVTNYLTVNVGLRYEYSTPKSDTQGRSFSIIPGQQSTVFPNAPIGLVFPGDKGAPTGANFPDKNDFAPRFGFAWQPFHDEKTVVRGGFGVFYDVLKGEDNLQFNGQPPFFSYASFNFSKTPSGAGPYTYLKDPFTSSGNPNSFPSKPVDHNIDIYNTFGSFGDGGVYFVAPKLRTPYVFQYNLSVQRDLGDRLVAQAAYVGTGSRKLTALMDVNPFDLKTINGANPLRLLNETPGNQPDSFSYLEEFRNVGNANYNSLQLSLNKRPGQMKWIGQTYFELAYTLAHNLDNASGFRNYTSAVPYYQPNFFHASSDFDVRHTLALSGGWDLPFNKGPKTLVKGWSLYPIVTYRTGFPLSPWADGTTDIGDPGSSGAGDSGLSYANLVGPVQYFDPHTQQTLGGVKGNFWFNPTSFDSNYLNTSAEYQPNAPYGTASRNMLRGPGRTNMDLALAKNTMFYKEKIGVEFRAEAFNLFNHTEFKDPNTTGDSANFGRVLNTYDPRILQLGLRFSF